VRKVFENEHVVHEYDVKIKREASSMRVMTLSD
jgi:hypothetical protein